MSEEVEALKAEIEKLKADSVRTGLAGALLSDTELVSLYEYNRRIEEARLKDLAEAERRGEERGWKAAKEREKVSSGAEQFAALRYRSIEDWRASEEYKKEGK